MMLPDPKVGTSTVNDVPLTLDRHGYQLSDVYRQTHTRQAPVTPDSTLAMRTAPRYPCPWRPCVVRRVVGAPVGLFRYRLSPRRRPQAAAAVWPGELDEPPPVDGVPGDGVVSRIRHHSSWPLYVHMRQ